MFLFICLLIILICLHFEFKWTKQEVAEYYGICRKTLGKWVQHCCIIIDYSKWKKVRKLDVIELVILFLVFGEPNEGATLTKGSLVKRCETYYHTMRENINLNFEKLGISRDAYSKLDIFPPRLSRKMLRVMGE